MLRDAALAANIAWLIVAPAYLLTDADFGGGSFVLLIVIAVGFPLLNLLALLRNRLGEWRD